MKALQEVYSETFKQSSPDVMIVLNFDQEKICIDSAYEKVHSFVQEVAKLQKTQIVGVVVFEDLPQPCMQILLSGPDECLYGLTSQEVERFWGYGSVFVSSCWGYEQSQYLALKITPHAENKYVTCSYRIYDFHKYKTS